MHARTLAACLAAAVVVSVPAVGPAVASAAVASADVTAAVKSATDISPHRQDIRQAVNGYVKQLGEGDPLAAADARKKLIGLMQGFQVSQPFKEEVAREAARALTPLVRQSQDPIRRLNAAIAIAGLAQESSSLQLLPAVQAAMQADSKPVQIWGVRASRHLIPATLPQPDATLHQQVIDLAQANIAEGLLVSEAFQALRVDDVGRLLEHPKKKNEILDGLEMLMRERLKLYSQPSLEATGWLPEVDWLPPTYLVNLRIWDQMDEQRQAQVVQLTVDLVEAAFNRMQQVSQVEQGPYAQVIRKMGQSLGAVALSENIQLLAAPSVSLSQIPLRPPQVSTTRARVQAVFSAVGQVWPNVKVPQV